MNKFVEHFRNLQGKLTTEQATRLADEFGRIAKDLVDPNGQKIFRYNRRTHNIEPASIASHENEKAAVTSENISPKENVKQKLLPWSGSRLQIKPLVLLP